QRLLHRRRPEGGRPGHARPRPRRRQLRRPRRLPAHPTHHRGDIMSVDRGRVAGWLGGAAGAGGAGIAMLVCCTTTAAAAGGGLAATGGVLRSPWLIAAGLVVIALALAAFIVQRTGRPNAGADVCCPPSMVDPLPAPREETSQR